MFRTVLVANRGEIAVRILRTLARLGVRSVAVYSDADRAEHHVAAADQALRIGPEPPEASYLDQDAIIAAAKRSGAEAIHPGYGFLAESATFARRCLAAGIVFIGPPPEVIELLGDKIAARKAAVESGLPVLAASIDRGLSDEDLHRNALSIGFPLLIKPAAGGGGKAMHLVSGESELDAAIATARREARRAFGDDQLFVERFLEQTRHIEVQVFGDVAGNVVVLGDRECSLQRRYQKIIEESPAPNLTADTRRSMHDSARTLSRACAYVGAGTVEFIVSNEDPPQYFFLEMNTRLQVEHGITELLSGVDLVELQLRVAAGEALPTSDSADEGSGHAIEARLCAEDPLHGFLPTGGTVVALLEPQLPQVRFDSGIGLGSTISQSYDPLLMKIMAWGDDRESALARLRAALRHTVVLGVTTNLAFLLKLIDTPEVATGHLDTSIAEALAAGLGPDQPPDRVIVAAALFCGGSRRDTSRPSQPASAFPGWRLGEDCFASWSFEYAGESLPTVRHRGTTGAVEISIGERPSETARADIGDDVIHLELDNELSTHHVAWLGDELWIEANGRTWLLNLAGRNPDKEGEDAVLGGPVRSPTPGTVVDVQVSVGDRVKRGASMVTIEAMKMEHVVTAPRAGTVVEVHVEVGSRVKLDEPLVLLETEEAG